MRRLTPEQVLTLSMTELVAQPSDVLFQLKNDATDLLRTATAIIEQLEAALEHKYAKRADTLRQLAGKDSGVVHFHDGEVYITADRPRTLEWDQAQLADLARRMTASGDDPTSLIDITYGVSESKYKEWPDALRTSLASARIFRPGKPSFRMALIAGDQM